MKSGVPVNPNPTGTAPAQASALSWQHPWRSGLGGAHSSRGKAATLVRFRCLAGLHKISVATKYQFQKTCTTKIISLLQCMRVVVIHSVVHHPGTLVLAISCRWQLFRLDAKEGRSAHSVAPSKFKEVHMVTRHWNLL